MFWTVMTAITVAFSVAYGVIGAFGERWGISPERAGKFTRSSWLALGWTAVALGNYVLALRGGR